MVGGDIWSMCVCDVERHMGSVVVVGEHMGYVCGGDGGGNESYSKCAASICVFLSCSGSALCQAPVFSFTQQFICTIWFPLD